MSEKTKDTPAVTHQRIFDEWWEDKGVLLFHNGARSLNDVKGICKQAFVAGQLHDSIFNKWAVNIDPKYMLTK